MKATTKFEKEVESLSKTVRRLTATQRKEAIGLLPKEAWYSGRDFGCFGTECGHEWDIDGKPEEKITCPQCGAMLDTIRTRKENDKRYAFMAIMRVYGPYQVIRIIEARRIIKGKRVFSDAEEVIRFWVDDKGKYVQQTIRYGIFYYNVHWKYGTEMELRKPCFSTNFYVDKVYQRQSVLPLLERNGYKGKLYGFTPFDVVVGLLKNPMFETLWKAGRYDILENTRDMNELRAKWPSIRIVLRNNYHTSDWKLWFDTVSMMRWCDMDVTNRVYVCAKDIKAVHDEAQRRIRRKEQLEEKKQLEKKLVEADKMLAWLQRYAVVAFGDDMFNVSMLHTADEYWREGNEMHHCVWASEYYAKKNCLILSVRNKSDERVATVELSLSSYTIQQCRAAFNKKPDNEQMIINLINNNIYRYKQLKQA